ncbi:MAG TPA: hypothetical protein VKU82_03870 [Planctomycetaceae bacterium]|nr:hypothetical protein [Planctomycetaceae bacterium]
MKRRQQYVNSLSSSAEVLEARALLSASSAGVAGALAHPMIAPGAAAALHAQAAVHADILSQLSATTPVTASTIPANGDLNPYGTAFVPQGFVKGGVLQPGDLLVSNFNNSSNLQGTGTTIVRVTPSGQTSTFFQGQAGLGLTTALGVLKGGFVIVGNVPTTDGTGATAQQGSLLILDKNGHVVETLTNSKLLDGPWDLTVNDNGVFAQVFVSNVLSGTVTRIDMLVLPGLGKPLVLDETQIASGFTHRTDPAALLLGPTGLAFDAKTDTLFVASTADNEVFAIHNAAFRFSDAGTGKVIYQDSTHLHGPLALVLAPNGDLIVSNGRRRQCRSGAVQRTGGIYAKREICLAVPGRSGARRRVRHRAHDDRQWPSAIRRRRRCDEHRQHLDGQQPRASRVRPGMVNRNNPVAFFNRGQASKRPTWPSGGRWRIALTRHCGHVASSACNGPA